MAAGAKSLPADEVDVLELRIQRLNPHALAHLLSSSVVDLGKQYVFLPKTPRNDQIPVVSLAFDFSREIPAATLLVCLNVLEDGQLRTLGIRFETGNLDPDGEVGSHSFPHAQLTSVLDLGYKKPNEVRDCHDNLFASYPAMFGNADNPGDLMLALLVSTYGLTTVLSFINPTEHWDLRREVVARLRRMLPSQVAAKLPSI